MRVIAGTYRGRRLRAPRGRATRPTSDRVREAVFSIIGPLEGAAVLDLFAGTGALGIEALSRGAQSVVFVEREPAALRALRANLRSLGVDADRAQVRAVDALAALGSAAARGEAYDLVLIDPPYATAAELGPRLDGALPPLLAQNGRVVAESDRRSPLQLSLPTVTERRYGDTSIRIHRT